MNEDMLDQNLIVHGMWIGGILGDLELLTLKSFLHHGHEFHLWIYDDVGPVPESVVIEDASEIISMKDVFRYPADANMDFYGGAGSYAGFSDIFRYKLLYEKGGWWSDMDITCLKPLNTWEPYCFRNHWKLLVVGNIMKVPPKSELMRICYERAAEEIDENNKCWNKPIEILCETIEKLKLNKFIRYGLGNLDHQQESGLYLYDTNDFPQAWCFVHWMNAAKQDGYIEESAFCRLLQEYGLHVTKYETTDKDWSRFV